MAGIKLPSLKSAAPYDPNGLSGADKLAILGATLKDFSSGLQGGDGGALMGLQGLLSQRQLLGRRQTAQDKLDALFNPQRPYTGSGPGVDGEPLTPKPEAATPKLPTLRDALPTILSAARDGVDVKTYIDALDKVGPSIKIGPDGRPYDERDPSVLSRRFGNPTVVSNKVVDLNDEKNLDTYIPEAPVKGAVPVYGPNGKAGGVLGWQMPNGALQAIESVEFSTSRGKAAGAAPWEFESVTDRDGRPVKVAKSSAAGGVFVGQSPAEELAAKNAVESAERAPGLIAQADQTLGLINSIINDPQRANRTGGTALIWGIPGTAGADFDRKVDQLKGQVFLQAFNQLKGGGAITEIEGKKAEQAIARLDRAQSEQGFMDALKDLSDVITLGRQRVVDSLKKTTQPSTGGGSRPAPASGNYSVVGVRRAGQ